MTIAEQLEQNGFVSSTDIASALGITEEEVVQAAFDAGVQRCSVETCNRISTCAIKTDDGYIETFCELHFGAWLVVNADDHENEVRTLFRSHSADLAGVQALDT